MSTYLKSKMVRALAGAVALLHLVSPVPAPEAVASDIADPQQLPPVVEQAPPSVASPEPPSLNKAKRKPPPKPVAWLSQKQMNNAAKIVAAAKDLGLGKRAQVIGIMTALQESRISNLASTVYPSSMDIPHDGVGSDHDSVGVFQQRPSMGWGSIRQCMTVTYSAKAFFKSLKRVDGWQGMSLTHAAQAVQKSAYPEAYAKHESIARRIVAEVNNPRS